MRLCLRAFAELQLSACEQPQQASVRALIQPFGRKQRRFRRLEVAMVNERFALQPVVPRQLWGVGRKPNRFFEVGQGLLRTAVVREDVRVVRQSLGVGWADVGNALRVWQRFCRVVRWSAG